MRIIVIGASGRVGQDVVKDLQAQGDHVIATSRHPQDLGDERIVLDLHEEADELAKQLPDADAIIFTAGSNGRDLLGTDLDGAIKTMQAAKQKGINRYIMLSAAYATDRSQWQTPAIQSLRDYYIAKHYADLYLINDSGLAYTDVQPSALTEDAATGKTTFTANQSGSNTIADVADVIAQVTHADNTIGKIIMMHGGNTPIKDAIAAV